MPLKLKKQSFQINKQRQKEVFDYLNRLLNDNNHMIYFDSIYKDLINELDFDGFYQKKDDQYIICQHTNHDAQMSSMYINPYMLNFIIEKTPFFTESIQLCLKTLNKTGIPFGLKNLSFIQEQFPETYALVQKNFSTNNIQYIFNILDILFNLNKYVLDSNLIFLKNSQEKE